jgi:YD repeat-containing protein
MTRKVCPNGNVTVFDCTSKREGTIVLPTGEVLCIRRNQYNFIEKIEGSVSGYAEYIYNGSRLISVRDNDGVVVKFSYDSRNNIETIQKADGKTVKLKYEFNSFLYRDMCVSVTDEDGNSEYFSYNPAERHVIHKTSDGGTESFIYNPSGVTVYHKEADGKESYFYPDGRGLVERTDENGMSKSYVYDSFFRLNRVSYDSGGTETYSYNGAGKLIKHTDRDGFSNQWEYDNRGNLTASYFNEAKISSCTYFPNGLLKSLEENSQKKYYSYNQFGYVTSRTVIADGKTLTENWEYDSMCRVTKYTDAFGIETSISYPDLFSRIEIYGNIKKTERHFNERLFEIETIETDLKSGISYKKNVSYDGRGNAVKIRINGIPVADYIYTPGNKVKSYTVWNSVKASGCDSGNEIARQGIKTEFTYDNAGRILEEKRSILNEGDEGRKSIQEGECI